jgi:hypothetical protein
MVRIDSRRFAGGHEFFHGDLGGPIQIADERTCQSEQNNNLDQQGSNNCRPIEAAIHLVLPALLVA